VKKYLKICILGKTIVTVLLLVYALSVYFFATIPKDEAGELSIIEFGYYSISSLLLIYFFYNMTDMLKFAIIFDFIFLSIIWYYFQLNYIIFFLDLVTFSLILLENTDVKNFIKRRLRSIRIYLNH
jgi:hypothetical protein